MSEIQEELSRKHKRIEILRGRKAQDSQSENQQPSGDGDSVEAILRDLGIDPTPGVPLVAATKWAEPEEPVPASSVPASNSDEAHANQASVLTMSQVTQTNIQPRETQMPSYCKETQTLQVERDRDGRLSESHVDSPRFLSTLEWDDEFNHQMSLAADPDGILDAAAAAFSASDGVSAEATLAQLRANGLALAAAAAATAGAAATATSSSTTPTQTPTAATAAQQQPLRRELSDGERQQILLSDGFQRFFDRASRVMERALAEGEADDADGEGDGEEEYNEAAGAGRASVRVCRTFYDDRWSRGRCVTALDWSPHYPELCLAAYSEQAQSHDSDGVLCVWNARYRRDSPEFALQCQSPLTSACFAAYQRCLLIGGTYSGQLVLWDTRTHRRTPVQRSPLGAQGHTQPCVFTRVAGTERASCLLSLSSDARLCAWAPEMLSQPVHCLDLAMPASLTAVGGFGGAKGALAPTCMELLDANRFVVGSEDYRLGVGCRHGTRAGLLEPLSTGHQAPVTSVSVNPSPDLAHVVLSASIDWTARLWSLREPAEPPLALEEATDYVLDARWSPVHPGLLCTADASGRLDFWSLGADSEQPLARCQPMADAGVAPGGLNRCCFNRSGCVLTAGDHLGRVALLELSEALATPRPNEAQLVLRALHEARQARADLR